MMIFRALETLAPSSQVSDVSRYFALDCRLERDIRWKIRWRSGHHVLLDFNLDLRVDVNLRASTLEI